MEGGGRRVEGEGRRRGGGRRGVRLTAETTIA